MSRRAILFVLSVLAVAPGLAQQSVDFSGSVKDGRNFTREIGHGLQFELRSDGTGVGYQIIIGPASGDEKVWDFDFTGCVTSPFHGPGPTHVVASEFFDEKGNRLPEQQLAPLKNREFSFVRNSDDNRKACLELAEIQYGHPKTDKQGNVVLGGPGYRSPATGRGTFHLRSYELSGAGQSASFVSMTFDVHLEFPKPATVRPRSRK